MATATVNNIPSLLSTANSASTGDVIILTDGTYINTPRTSIKKSGVIVKALNQGKAIIKGSPIDLAANDIEFSGFDLQYSSTDQTVIKISSGCKLLRNKIHFTNSITTRQDWIVVSGNNCQIEDNEIFSKTGMGNFILVGGGSAIITGTKIRNNKIHDQSGGSGNGAEAIRLGSSATAKAAFNSDISGNTLEKCSTTDDELITVKSSNNDIHDNHFINCNSGITFRHGSFNKYRNNININTGLRIYGHNQEVTGNQFLRDSNSQIKQVVVGNGDSADDGILGKSNAIYSQVHDCIIQNNYFIGEDVDPYYLLCWGYGTRSFRPINNKIINNIFTASKGTLAHTKDGASWSGNTVTGNTVWVTGTAVIGDMPVSGYVKKDPQLIKNPDGTYSLPPPPPPTCQPNAHYDVALSKCVCDTGYHDDGTGNCVKDIPICKSNAHYDSVLDKCVCDTGYHDDGSGNCVINLPPPPPPPPTCQPNAHYDIVLGKCVCNTGYHDDGSGNCVIDLPPPPPPVPINVDKFGVKKIYQTKLNGEEWFMSTTNILNDSRVIPSSNLKTSGVVKMNADGSFKVTTAGDVDNRLNIVTSGGYDHNRCVLDWNVLKTRKYMQNPQDWKNVEITGYVRINKIATSGHSLVWYARGGHHSSSYHCEGSAYKGNIRHTGYTRFQKEMGHGDAALTYFETPDVKTSLVGNIIGKWFGYKFCCYDLANGDVKLENWLDVNMDNNWIKVLERVDSGGWGKNNYNCGGALDQRFIWGGPQAVFRFDSTNDIDFKKLSIREIKI